MNLKLLLAALAVETSSCFFPNSLCRAPPSVGTRSIEFPQPLFSSNSDVNSLLNNDAIISAYNDWRNKFGKGDFDPVRFRSFENNYKILMNANIRARDQAAAEGRELPQWLDLNEYGDYSREEYAAMRRGEPVRTSSQQPPTTNTGQEMLYGTGPVHRTQKIIEPPQPEKTQTNPGPTSNETPRSTQMIQPGPASSSATETPNPTWGTQVIRQSEPTARSTQVIARNTPRESPASQYSSWGTQKISQDPNEPTRGTQVIQQAPEQPLVRGTQVIQQAPEQQPVTGTQVIQQAPEQQPTRGTQVIQKAPEPQPVRGTQVIQQTSEQQPVRGTQVIQQVPEQEPIRGTQVIQQAPEQPPVRGTQVIQQAPEQAPMRGTQVIQQAPAQQPIRGTQVIQQASEQPPVRGTQVIQQALEQQPIRGTQVVRQASEQQPVRGTQVIQQVPQQPPVRGTQVIQQAPEQQPIRGTQVIQQAPEQPPMRGTQVIQQTAEQQPMRGTQVIQQAPEQPSMKGTQVIQQAPEQQPVRGTQVIRPSANPTGEGPRGTIVIPQPNGQQTTDRGTRVIESSTPGSSSFGNPIGEFLDAATGSGGTQVIRQASERVTASIGGGTQIVRQAGERASASIFSFFGGPKMTEEPPPSVRGTVKVEGREKAETTPSDNRPETVLVEKSDLQQIIPSIFSFFGLSKKADEDSEMRAEAEPAPMPKPVITKPKGRPSLVIDRNAVDFPNTANLPEVRRWWQNSDGSMTGYIYNSKNFNDGTKLTTSPLQRAACKAGNVVRSGGQEYLLK